MTNAIILASGLGTRLRPITNSTPKPLIPVGKTTLIETVICALQQSKVDNIYVVVGYLSEQFFFLTKKYKNLQLILNPDYEKVNNISSLYYANEILRMGDCFVCEADLYVKNKNILNIDRQNSGYFGKYVEGVSDDWVFDTNQDGIISRVGKNGRDCFNMVGFSFFLKQDAQMLANKITETYHRNGYEKLFWDDVVNQNLDRLKLEIFPVDQRDIFEIDTTEDLKKLTEVIEHEC